MVVATIALVVAMGGTGWALATLPRNSVGPNQLRAHSVHQIHILPHSLLRSDFAPRQLPAGNSVVIRTASGGQVGPASAVSVVASCSAGEHAVGGGGSFAKDAAPNQQDRLASSEPLSANDDNHTGAAPTKWRATLFNGGSVPRTPLAYAVCLSP